MAQPQDVKKKQGGFDRFLSFLERAGNKLPEPLMIFVWLAAIVVILSFIGSVAGFSAIHPGTQKEVTIVNLLSIEGLQRMLSEAVTNFSNFPPLGLVLVIMLGVGLCDKTGLFSALLRKTMANVKGTMVVVVMIFVAINANVAGDTGSIVVPPLAAMVFAAAGRNPIVGAMAGYAGVVGGFSANLLVSSLDVLLSGFTQSAANLIDPKLTVNPAMNWYFLIVSTFLLTFVGTWVTVKVVEPRVGKYTGEIEEIQELTDKETKALKMAGIALLIFAVLVIGLAIPQNSFLRDPKTHSLLSSASTFMKGLIPIITLAFFIPALVYGKVSGVIKNDKDLASLLAQTMADMSGYIVLVFVMAQFINYFNWSNLGIVLAIKGAEFLKALAAPAPVLLVLFIIIASLINLLMASASAKWAIMSPIFVPMFMLLGLHPALTQVVFRIGDSITNIITPLLPYFAMLVAVVRKYDKNAGMGTLIANMLPYTIAFFLMWTVQLILWFLLKLPLGPGSPVLY